MSEAKIYNYILTQIQLHIYNFPVSAIMIQLKTKDSRLMQVCFSLEELLNANFQYDFSLILKIEPSITSDENGKDQELQINLPNLIKVNETLFFKPGTRIQEVMLLHEVGHKIFDIKNNPCANHKKWSDKYYTKKVNIIDEAFSDRFVCENNYFDELYEFRLNHHDFGEKYIRVLKYFNEKEKYYYEYQSWHKNKYKPNFKIQEINNYNV